MMDAAVAAVTRTFEAKFGSVLDVALQSVRADIASQRADIASNHGHVTKRLFPALEDKLTSLASTVDSRTGDLANKGESLLTKVNSIDFLVGGEDYNSRSEDRGGQQQIQRETYCSGVTGGSTRNASTNVGKGDDVRQ